jgi:hypothetical protein
MSLYWFISIRANAKGNQIAEGMPNEKRKEGILKGWCCSETSSFFAAVRRCTPSTGFTQET